MTLSELTEIVGYEPLEVMEHAKKLGIEVRQQEKIKEHKKLIDWYTHHDIQSRIFNKKGYYNLGYLSKDFGIAYNTARKLVNRHKDIKTVRLRSVIHLEEKEYNKLKKRVGAHRTDLISINEIRKELKTSHQVINDRVNRLGLYNVKYISTRYILKKDANKLRKAVKTNPNKDRKGNEIEGYFSMFQLVDELNLSYETIRHQIINRKLIDVEKINRRIYVKADKMDELKYKLGIGREGIISLNDVCSKLKIDIRALRYNYTRRMDVEEYNILGEYYIDEFQFKKVKEYIRKGAKPQSKVKPSKKKTRRDNLDEYNIIKGSALHLGVDKKDIYKVEVDVSCERDIAKGIEHIKSLIKELTKDKEYRYKLKTMEFLKNQEERTELENTRRTQMRSALFNASHLIIYPNFFLDAGEEHIIGAMDDMGIKYKEIENRPTSLSNKMKGYLLSNSDFYRIENFRNLG